MNPSPQFDGALLREAIGLAAASVAAGELPYGSLIADAEASLKRAWPDISRIYIKPKAVAR